MLRQFPGLPVNLTRRMEMAPRIGDLPPGDAPVAYDPMAGLPMGEPFAEARAGLDLPPPFISKPILCGATATLPVGAKRQEIIAFKIPAGMLAVVRGIANGFANISDSSSVRWAFTLDAAGVSGYGNFVGPLTPSIAAPKYVALVCNAGQRIAWLATNLAAIPIGNVSAMFEGWMWPLTIRPVAGG